MIVFTKLNNLQLKKSVNTWNNCRSFQICSIRCRYFRSVYRQIVTSIASVFSPLWSLLSSVSYENLWFWHSMTTLAPRPGANAFLTIMVVFVRPDMNFPAISLSGNKCLTNFEKWSTTENGRLCSATNCANLT